MSDVKQNTIATATAIVVLLLLRKKKLAEAAEGEIAAGALIDESSMDQEDQQTYGCGLMMDQRDSIYIRVPGYQVYRPQQLLGPAKVEQADDDNIILTHYE